MTRISLLLTAAALISPVALLPVSASAQKVPACTIIPDAIVPLKVPSFEGAVEWRRVLGIEGADLIADMMPLADGGIIVVGETTPYTREKGRLPPQLLMIRLDVTGKPIFEKRLPLKDFKKVAGGVILRDKIITASQLQDAKGQSVVQLDFIDGGGTQKLKPVVISETNNDLIPADIVINADGTTLTLGVTVISRKNAKDSYTVLYRLDGAGKVISRREFLPGVPNRLERLERLSSGQIVGAGRVRAGDAREAGWLLMVSRQGDLVMQRQFPRGSQAQLTKVIDDGAGGMYAFGESIPSDGTYRAGWLMRLNGQGEVIWQRFFKGKYRYGAVDGSLMKDGRVQVLMYGRPVDEGGREHARVLSVSSIGDIQQEEAFLESTNAVPVRIMEHSVTKRRLLAGYAQTGFADYGIPEEEKLATYDAWIAGIPSLPMFEDPCKPAQRETLDDAQ